MTVPTPPITVNNVTAEGFATGTIDAPGVDSNAPVVPVQNANPSLVSQAATQTGQQPQTFTAEDIERARAQEREKQYKERQAVEERLSVLQQDYESRQAVAAEAQKQAEEEAQRKAQEEMSLRELLEQQKAEFEKRLENIQAENEQERLLHEKEKEFATLQAYIQRRVGEVQDEIAPELLDLINGNNTDEVEASIVKMQEKTSRILESVQQAQAPIPPSGVSPTGYAAAGPLDNAPGTRQLSADDIRNMSMSDWAEHRKNFVGQSATAGNRGLFG